MYHLGPNNDESMDHGAIEALINRLPNDLATFVAEDNKNFDEERKKWLIDQENRKKQEALAQEKELQSLIAGVEPDSSNDVEVMRRNLDRARYPDLL